MKQPFNQKIGVLGAGQLGKMLCQAASQWHLHLDLLDQSEAMPAVPYAPHFTKGDFTDYQNVLDFGRKQDIVTVEIEKVNTAALMELEEEGILVYPQSRVLAIIKDKGQQKQFYKNHDFPSAEFELFDDKRAIWQDILEEKLSYPFVQKARRDGYDGRGVVLIHTEDDLPKLMDCPSVVEKLIDFKKELSCIVARNIHGEIKTYPVSEMMVDPESNQLNYLICPTDINDKITATIKKLSENLIQQLDMVGLLAIELFLDKDNQITINEIAPRPHNSGHQTIEGNDCSQYEQHLRAILGLPLGSTALRSPCALVNIVGDINHQGPAILVGEEKILAMAGTHVHWYGKTETKPNRKMGHVTILGNSQKDLIDKIKVIKDNLKVIS